jgi:hypothetical protein
MIVLMADQTAMRKANAEWSPQPTNSKPDAGRPGFVEMPVLWTKTRGITRPSRGCIWTIHSLDE